MLKHPLLFFKTPKPAFSEKPAISGHFRSSVKVETPTSAQLEGFPITVPVKEFESIALLGSELTSPSFLCIEKKTRHNKK